jgi:hypothetical protein
VASLFLAALVALCSATASALVGLPPEFVLADAGTGEGVPPEPPQFDTVAIRRGTGTRPADESCTHFEGGNRRGSIVLTPLEVEDESGPLGLRLRLARGTLPSGLELPSYPLAPHSNGQISLTFDDPRETRTLPFDFTLSITAVRRSGAESEPTAVVVEHDGKADWTGVPECEERGCSVVTGQGSPGASWSG